MNVDFKEVKKYYLHEDFVKDSYDRFNCFIIHDIGWGHFPESVDKDDEVSFIGEVTYFDGIGKDMKSKSKSVVYKITFIMHIGAYEFTPILKSIEEIEYKYKEEDVIPYVVGYIDDNDVYIKTEYGYSCIKRKQYEENKDRYFKDSEKVMYRW